MKPSTRARAVRAAISLASSLGLPVTEAVVLQDSNRLTLHLLPCSILARVADVAHQAGAERDVEVARQLATTTSPVEVLDLRVEPRVYLHEGFAITWWTYYEPATHHAITPPAYAHALAQLHAGMQTIAPVVPHFTERVAQAQRLVDTPASTPDLNDADRAFLSAALRTLMGAIRQRCGAEQLIHGEPHPGNLLITTNGILFVDVETCCYGPVEFDIAHAPDAVDEHYPGADRELLRLCRLLALAIVAAWRWDRDDQLPHGRQMGGDIVKQLRAAMNQID